MLATDFSFSLLHKSRLFQTFFAETCDSWTVIHLPFFPAALLTCGFKLSGGCTFESDQCQWTHTSDEQSRWQRQKASNNTEPPTDHTIGTGDFSGLLNSLLIKWHGSEIIITTLSMFKLSWFGMFSLVFRLLHDSKCQSGVHTEWDPTPESHTPLVIPLLPDSVSDNHDIDGHISLIIIIPNVCKIFVLIQSRIFKVWIAQCSPTAPVSLPRSSLPNPTLSPSSFLLS